MKAVWPIFCQSVEAISHSCANPVHHSEAELFLLCSSVPDSLSLPVPGGRHCHTVNRKPDDSFPGRKQGWSPVLVLVLVCWIFLVSVLVFWFWFCSVVYRLLSSCRRMRQSQKTVYRMCQAMNMPGSFWLMHQLKDFGCLLGERSKLCNVSVQGFE